MVVKAQGPAQKKNGQDPSSRNELQRTTVERKNETQQPLGHWTGRAGKNGLGNHPVVLSVFWNYR